MFSLAKKISAYLVVPFGWTIILTALMCIPGSEFPSMGWIGFKHVDKITHFGLYGLLVLFWAYYALYNLDYGKWKNLVLYICFFAIVYGIIMEFVQLNFIPNRDFDIWDILANSVGAIVFTFIVLQKEKLQ